jgi:methionine-rich copper-binding protein CopC
MRKLLLGLPILLACGQQALAHAVLIDSTPAAGATVPPGPLDFQLHYNSRIDRGRSILRLTAPDHSQSVVPIRDEGAPDMLRATLTVAPGAYVLRWQVLAVDGHITRGDVPFTVSPTP